MCTLTKKSNSETAKFPNNFKEGHSITGKTFILPGVGGRFAMFYTKEEQKRAFFTSTIQEILYQDEKRIEFRTINTIYELIL